MNILGISFLEDASACVLKDGRLIAALAQERLNRKKLWFGVPHEAIREVLKLTNTHIDEIDFIATHGKCTRPDRVPFDQKIELIIQSQLDERGKQEQIEAVEKRYQHEVQVCTERTPTYLSELDRYNKPIVTYGHHEAHAASAIYGWGEKNCYLLTADGWGEDGSSTLWKVENGLMKKLSFSHPFDSLGYFYGSVTKSLGFIPHRHEGKVLGLAAFCRNPKSYDGIRAMIDFDRENMRFLGKMENGLYRPHFDNPRLDQFVKSYSREDVASAAQISLEEVVCSLVNAIDDHEIKLGLAGGIFANVKLNQRIRELPKVKDVFISPNMGDGGLSVGAALLAYFQKKQEMPAPVESVLLGNDFSNEEIRTALSQTSLKYNYYDNIEEKIAELLAEKQVVSVANGPMEFGPRALGNRSILFHARDKKVNDWLNHALQRSEFMPFAPATLKEKAMDCYVNINLESQSHYYMTMTYDCTDAMIKNASAAVHVDGTARPQIVSLEKYPRFYKILSRFYELTGEPTVINTSFNMHEEPIVCTPEDAIRAFKSSRLPYLALGNYLLEQTSK